jgi:caffeoyl-CoA O-methyltransferase
MDFIDPAIEEYARAHSEGESALLQELNRETYAKVLIPRMLSGHLQGRVLSMISKLIQPKNILEIGTYTGYSALCLAEGLLPDGELHTIDINEELESMILKYFNKSAHSKQLKPHIGNALEIIPTLNKTWDLVFIDADKENYANYFDIVIDSLRPGGIIIADNVLWSGKVLKETEAKDEETRALKVFNEKVFADERVESVLLPIRDGLMVLRKK